MRWWEFCGDRKVSKTNGGRDPRRFHPARAALNLRLEYAAHPVDPHARAQQIYRRGGKFKAPVRDTCSAHGSSSLMLLRDICERASASGSANQEKGSKTNDGWDPTRFKPPPAAPNLRSWHPAVKGSSSRTVHAPSKFIYIHQSARCNEKNFSRPMARPRVERGSLHASRVRRDIVRRGAPGATGRSMYGSVLGYMRGSVSESVKQDSSAARRTRGMWVVRRTQHGIAVRIQDSDVVSAGRAQSTYLLVAEAARTLKRDDWIQFETASLIGVVEVRQEVGETSRRFAARELAE
ncbi:hypothetical protein B0H11DRAFT_1940853 [Mycena galericulata]|nr:hypothetical protein B0H11DRAFT_1940853 [Mycena galericulata]